MAKSIENYPLNLMCLDQFQQRFATSKNENNPERMWAPNLHTQRHLSPSIIACNSKTSDFYKIKHKLPFRFEHPEIIQGYGILPRGRKWFTSNSEYGNLTLTFHHMPHVYYKVPWKSSDLAFKRGNYRYTSLNICKNDYDI